MPVVRKILELATRKIVFRRRLPKQYGGRPFYVSTEGGLKYLKAQIDQVDRTLLDAAAKVVSPGDIVWDIGANVGLFSFAASGLAGATGAVYAIEPDTVLVNLLRRSAAMPCVGPAPVRIIPVAVSGFSSVAHFRVARRARASNFLAEFGGMSQTGGVREEQTVVTVTLDWLLGKIPAPNVVKIDIEGGEAAVLRGAEDVLSKHRPKIVCEVADKNVAEVTRSLHKYSYELFDLDSSGERVCQAVWNTLAIPKND